MEIKRDIQDLNLFYIRPRQGLQAYGSPVHVVRKEVTSAMQIELIKL
jgi:hypothetical protein